MCPDKWINTVYVINSKHAQFIIIDNQIQILFIILNNCYKIFLVYVINSQHAQFIIKDN